MTVRCQDALAHLRALPSQAPRHCIYADPPYIFPGRSMNYYGTRRRGHDLAFHSELRDALFASGLPFVLSINDVPEAWQLYSKSRLHHKAVLRQERLQARAAGSAPGQSCVWRRNGWGNPVASAGSTQDCQARARPAPGPHQAPIRLWYGARSDFRLRFSKPFAHFSAPKRAVTHCAKTVFGRKSAVLDR